MRVLLYDVEKTIYILLLHIQEGGKLGDFKILNALLQGM